MLDRFRGLLTTATLLTGIACGGEGPTPLPLPRGTIVPAEAPDGTTPGRLVGTFSTTPDGGAKWDLDLWVPPGRLGMQPSLAIRYDSRAGNGDLGVGWQITGGSRIERCRPTIAIDNFVAPIQFSPDDRYCLDGERLIDMGRRDGGAAGTTYRTWPDRFTRVLLDGTDPLGPTGFTAYARDGRILHYGRSPQTRIEGTAETVKPNGPGRWDIQVSPRQVRFAWLLERVEDRAGNTIDYAYADLRAQREKVPAQRVLATITYTGSTNPNDHRAPGRVVRFSWEARPDTRVRFISGLQLTSAFRLKMVEMLGPAPANQGLLRKYLLAYSSGFTGRSRLQSLTECVTDVCRAPTTFQYSEVEPDFEDIPTGITDILTTPGGISGQPGRVHVVDLNGDGRDDILYSPATPNASYVFRLGTEDASGHPGFSDPQPTGFTLPVRNERPHPLDFNADGRTDLLSLLDQPAIPGTKCQPGYWLAVATSPSMGGPTSLNPVRCFDDEYAEAADVDGDRLPDLLTSGFEDQGKALRTWLLWINSPTGLGKPGLFSTILAPNHRMIDLDGDGATEVLADAGIQGQGVFNTAYKFNRFVGGSPGQASGALTTLVPTERYILADLNGDGLSDVIATDVKSAGDGPYVLMNGGDGIFPPVPIASVLNFYWPAIRGINYRMDGQEDLIVRTRTQVQQDPLFVLESNGSALEAPVQLAPISRWIRPAEVEVFEVLDVNGDGLDDFLMYTDGSLHLFVRKGEKPDLLTAVEDRNGTALTLSYRPTSDAAVYTAGSTPCEYPQSCGAPRTWVLASYATNDGIGGANHFTLRYADGRSDVRGPAFLGFRATWRTHTEDGEVVEEDYGLTREYITGRSIYPFQGLPSLVRREVPLPGGNARVTIQHSTYQTKYHPALLTWSVAPLTTSVDDGIETATGLVMLAQNSTTWETDGYGNITRELRTGGGWVHDSTITFDPDSDFWLISNPTLVTVSSTTPSMAKAVRRTAFTYESRGLLHQVIAEPGAATASGWDPLGPQPDGVRTLYTTFDRKPDGQIERVTEHTTALPDPASRLISSSYDPAEGIFVIWQQDPVGHIRRSAYHPGLGVLAAAEAEDGIVSEAQYDPFGRVRALTRPGYGTTTISYAGQPVVGMSLVEVEVEGGAKQATSYDALDRPIQNEEWSRSDGKSVIELAKYDGLGRLAHASLPLFPGDAERWLDYDYDVLGRLVREAHPDGTAVSHVYGDGGPLPSPLFGPRLRRTTTIDARGHQRYVTTDQLGLVTESVEFDGTRPVRTSFTYGPFATEASVRLGGITTAYTRDRLGRVIAMDSRLTGHREFRYNAFGELESETTPQTTTSYQYDHRGRLKTVQSPEGATRYTWDAAPNAIGKLVHITTPNKVETALEYDAFGRLAGKRWEIDGSVYQYGFLYDGFGRLDSLSYPGKAAGNGPVVRYVYGNFGQLTSVRDAATDDPYWTVGAFDASEQFGDETLGNGLIRQWAEHSSMAGRLGSVETRLGATVVDRVDYEYDANGNVTSRTGGPGQRVESFGYDDLDRLSSWSVTQGTLARQMSYRYDDRGDLVVSQTVAGPGASFKAQLELTGPAPRLKTSFGTFDYDAQGNQTGGPARSIAYTSFDLPKAVTTGGNSATFRYDGELNRVVEERAGEQIVQAGPLYQRWVKGRHQDERYTIVANGRPVAERVRSFDLGGTATTATFYPLADQLGTVSQYTDATGTVVGTEWFEPFGLPIDAGGAPVAAGAALPAARSYAGHDPAGPQGLVDMRGRIYDPRLGRFLTPDPLLRGVERRAGLSPFAYALNNPATIVDPFGWDPQAEASETDAPLQGTCNGQCEFPDENFRNDKKPATPPPAVVAPKVAAATPTNKFADGPAAVATAGQAVSAERNTGLIASGPLESRAAFSLPYFSNPVRMPRAPDAGNAGFMVAATALAPTMEGLKGWGTLSTVARPAMSMGAVGVVAVAATAVWVLNQRGYVTYTLRNRVTGQIYVGRAGGFGTPYQIMMQRFASHEMRLLGFGEPQLDRYMQGLIGYDAIRGREQQLLDFYGGAKSPMTGNSIRAVSYYNPLRYYYHFMSNTAFGPLAPFRP